MLSGEALLQPFLAVGTPSTVLAISPHLDDAVMSAGATMHALARAGHEVVVATVFAGDPPTEISEVARRFHVDCALPDDRAMVLRRDEDRRALTTLGCRPLHLDLHDAIYRRDPSGGWLCRHDRAMFLDNLAPEPAVEASIVQLVGEIIASLTGRGRVAALLTCLGIGGHVDHRLTARSVIKIGTDWDIPVLQWEDLPYACDTKLGAVTASPAAILLALESSDWQAKESAVQFYASQLKMLWPQQERGWSLLLEHGRARGTQAPVECGWRG